MTKIPLEKISKKLFKVLNGYSSKTEMLNEMHQIGVSRHECMIVEMLLLGKSYESTKRVLLFTDASFSTLIDKLYDTLKSYNKKKALFNKLKG